MRALGAHGVLLLVLFIVVGGILGGIFGELLSEMNFGNIVPILSQHFEIFNVQNIDLNLYVMQIKFGLRFAPNLLSIIGIVVAFLIYQRL